MTPRSSCIHVGARVKCSHGPLLPNPKGFVHHIHTKIMGTVVASEAAHHWTICFDMDGKVKSCHSNSLKLLFRTTGVGIPMDEVGDMIEEDVIASGGGLVAGNNADHGDIETAQLDHLESIDLDDEDLDLNDQLPNKEEGAQANAHADGVVGPNNDFDVVIDGLCLRNSTAWRNRRDSTEADISQYYTIGGPIRGQSRWKQRVVSFLPSFIGVFSWELLSVLSAV
eukprot:scaffold117490_cov61-Attheya_sp.AAC.5